jgi:preprotein translocase subunit SecG
MNTDTIFTASQIVIAVLLMTAILLQNRGAGLGQTFGGDSSLYHTKRGLEKRLYQVTIVLAAAFIGVAVLQLIV